MRWFLIFANGRRIGRIKSTPQALREALGAITINGELVTVLRRP